MLHLTYSRDDRDDQAELDHVGCRDLRRVIDPRLSLVAGVSPHAVGTDTAEARDGGAAWGEHQVFARGRHDCVGNLDKHAVGPREWSDAGALDEDDGMG